VCVRACESALSVCVCVRERESERSERRKELSSPPTDVADSGTRSERSASSLSLKVLTHSVVGMLSWNSTGEPSESRVVTNGASYRVGLTFVTSTYRTHSPLRCLLYRRGDGGEGEERRRRRGFFASAPVAAARDREPEAASHDQSPPEHNNPPWTPSKPVL